MDILGGGTLIEDNSEAIECDIEVALNEYSDSLIDKIVGFFEATLAPIGSRLMVTSASSNLEEANAISLSG